jgi:predicted MPP superfamily phosphohydrolase
MITRRQLLRRVLRTGGVLTGILGLPAAYGIWEASQIRITRATVSVPNLPDPFVGKTIAVLADLHHGRWVSLSFIKEAVEVAKSLSPDLFALVGDFAHRGLRTHEELPPCLDVLSALQAPLGVYAVPGNHDMQNGGRVYRECIARTPLIDLTNRHHRITVDGADLWLIGVDDFWYGEPDQDTALKGVPTGAAVVMLCHNPDYLEAFPDERVGLALCGHTHGGQVYLPVVGSPWIPSMYGEKYRNGLVQGPASQVYVSRGLGEAGYPIRIRVPPEINVLTLQAG